MTRKPGLVYLMTLLNGLMIEQTKTCCMPRKSCTDGDLQHVFMYFSLFSLNSLLFSPWIVSVDKLTMFFNGVIEFWLNESVIVLILSPLHLSTTLTLIYHENNICCDSFTSCFAVMNTADLPTIFLKLFICHSFIVSFSHHLFSPISTYGRFRWFMSLMGDCWLTMTTHKRELFGSVYYTTFLIPECKVRLSVCIRV